jgi:hypothetical protein
VSEIIEDILGFSGEAAPEVIEPRPTKAKPVTEPKQEPDLMSQVSRVLEDLLSPINRKLDELDKRVSQPVQFKTSERQTGSSSAAKQDQEKPTGSAGQ